MVIGRMKQRKYDVYSYTFRKWNTEIILTLWLVRSSISEVNYLGVGGWLFAEIRSHLGTVNEKK